MKKSNAGRPAKYTEVWGNDHAGEMLGYWADGASLAEVCLAMGIVRTSYYKLCKLSEAFSDADKLGRTNSEAWWVQLGKDGATGEKPVQASVWIFNMKNRFGWRDKSEAVISGPEGGPVKIDSKIVVEFVNAESDTDNPGARFGGVL